ncbi:hypothetical protein [Kaistella sp.]|uniref:hypothetical protein n=1 Tax=Kaistella sp. TaxID=2782235 RepID=UPI003C5C303E
MDGIKRGSMSLQWQMGDHRKSQYDGGFCKREIDAGVLWKEGGVDAGEEGMNAVLM